MVMKEIRVPFLLGDILALPLLSFRAEWKGVWELYSGSFIQVPEPSIIPSAVVHVSPGQSKEDPRMWGWPMLRVVGFTSHNPWVWWLTSRTLHCCLQGRVLSPVPPSSSQWALDGWMASVFPDLPRCKWTYEQSAALITHALNLIVCSFGNLHI